MADACEGGGSGGLKAKPTIWLFAVAIAGAGSFLAARALEGPRHEALRAPPSADALGAHCAQFIALAKQQYGVNWKYRLDPRNGSICAVQVQQAWDRQWRPGADPASMPPVVEPTVTPIAPPAPVFVPVEPQPAMARTETYCLNIISFAKTKFGADWRSKLTADEAAACRGRIEATAR